MLSTKSSEEDFAGMDQGWSDRCIDSDEMDGYSIVTISPSGTAYGPHSDTPLFKKGLYMQSGKLARCAELLGNGFSCREIQRIVGSSKNTVKKLRNAMQAAYGISFKCACGKSALHQEWCEFRKRLSAERNAPR